MRAVEARIKADIVRHSANSLAYSAWSNDLPDRFLKTGMDCTRRPVGGDIRRLLGAFAPQSRSELAFLFCAGEWMLDRPA
jgi:hypothetical protein